MLTSSNQYLRPEYLTPLPTTLDAKKSPLALLAQTCSAIGADTPNPKLLASIEKSTKSTSTSSKTSTTPTTTTSSSNNESNNNTISGKTSHTPITRTSPVAQNPSPKTPSSFKPYENTPIKSPCPQNESSLRARTPKRSHTPLRPTSSNSSSANSPLPETSVPSSSPSLMPQTSKANFATNYMLGLPPPGIDHLKAAYLSYAAARGLKPDFMNPACRDPYCGGTCQMVTNKCPAGCLQCEHSKTPYPHHQHQAMAFAHAQLYALAAAASQPYVCNWMQSGDASTYCGKRFSNSEELLQHLRAHTGGPLGDMVSPLMAARAGYPTPPLSPLTLAAGRYHPYTKPMMPPGLHMPPHMMSSLTMPGSPYAFSPYPAHFGAPMPNLGLGQPPSRLGGAPNSLHH